jgi:hypothetical protein
MLLTWWDACILLLLLLLLLLLDLQVSDREYLATFPSWQEKIPLAQHLIDQGRPEDVVFRWGFIL